MNILFLNAGRRVELVDAFRVALDRRGGGIIFGSDLHEFAPALYRTDRPLLFPHSSDADFAAHLGDFCDTHEIALVIPTIDPDVEILSAIRDEVMNRAPHTSLLVPPTDLVALAADKRKTKEAFRRLSVRVPEDRTARDGVVSFPLFAKPVAGSAGIGAHPVHSLEEMQAHEKRFGPCLFEELLPGPEYTVDVLSDLEGVSRLAVPRRRERVRGGEVTRGVVARNEAIESTARRIADGLGSTGPITVQFLATGDGGHAAIEINARMGGGLPLTIAAGGFWPEAILALAAGEPFPELGPIDDGLRMSRYDQSVFFRAPSSTALATRVDLGEGRSARVSGRVAPVGSGSEPGLSGVDPAQFQAIVLDMDDTLYAEQDFVFSGYRAVDRRVVEDFGLSIEADLRRRFTAGQRGDLFTPTLRAAGVAVDERYVLELVKEYREHDPTIHPYADVPIVLERLGKRFQLGLVSDGLHAVQERKLNALNLKSHFSAIVFSDAIDGRRSWKPSTAPFIRVLDLLKVPASAAIYLGDNPSKDFEGARKVGLKTLRVRRSFGLHAQADTVSPSCAPDFEISSLAELLETWDPESSPSLRIRA